MMARLLVADDEQTILNFLVRVLVREGYEVSAAKNGYEALQLLEKNSFDLLLTDIKMDYLDGVSLLKNAKEHQPNLAVILLTGHATVDTAVAALQYGADNYLIKPAKNEDILEAVADSLNGRKREIRRDHLEAIAKQISLLFPPFHDLVPDKPSVIICGDLEVNTITYQAKLFGEALDLTPTEFRLLSELVKQPGVPIDYVELVQSACGYTSTRHEAQEIVGTHIRNLRRKLGVDIDQAYYIEAIRGIGYRLTLPENN